MAVDQNVAVGRLTANGAQGSEQLSAGAALVSTGWGRRDRITRRLLAGADVVGLIGAIALAALLAQHRDDTLELILVMVATLPAWVLLIKLYGLYDRDVKRISHVGVDDLPGLVHVLLVGMLLFWALCKALPVQQLTLFECALFGLAAVVAITVLRQLMRHAVAGYLGPEEVLFVGTGAVTGPLIQKIRQHPEYGLEPIGLLRNAAVDPEGITVGTPELGCVDDLRRIVAERAPDRIFICRSEFTAEQVLSMIDTCRRYSLKVSILPDALASLGPSVEIDEIEGVTVFGVNPPVLSRTSRSIKRGFDLLVAATVLLLSAPVIAAIAIAIRLDSSGPVLFRQERVGRGGRCFMLNKFRTMVADAESRRATLMASSSDHRWLHIVDDPRITRVGAFLRRTSLDELPQLWNVLRGEMSLVGPRPLPTAEDAHVGGRARSRLELTPGVTGLWQVLGRTTIPFDEMVKLDYVYVTNWSLWMDMRLLLRTLPAVLGRRGVN